MQDSTPIFYLRARLAGVVCVALMPDVDRRAKVKVVEEHDHISALRVAQTYPTAHVADQAAHRLGPAFWHSQDPSTAAHPKSALEVVEVHQGRARVATTYAATRRVTSLSTPPTTDPGASSMTPPSSMMGQPLTRADFEALITYRGPAVVARKDLFVQVNQALAARFEPMLGSSSSPIAYAAMRQDLRALAGRIVNPFFAAQAQDALAPLDAFAEHGESLTYPTITAALMGLRLWLNLAVLEDTLAPLDDLLSPPNYHAQEDAPDDGDAPSTNEGAPDA